MLRTIRAIPMCRLRFAGAEVLKVFKPQEQLGMLLAYFGQGRRQGGVQHVRRPLSATVDDQLAGIEPIRKFLR